MKSNEHTMSCTDTLQLNRTQMFAKIRAGLPDERHQTMNILDCYDDLLYAWDSVECCLLVLNWRVAQLNGIENVNHQTLIPSHPQSYQVQRILASHQGSLIALAGLHGVALLDLPRRWGKYGFFLEGKEQITCRCTELDARFFSNNPHVEVRQIRWHPSSPTDSHLLVLLSDNTIRVYDNNFLRNVWKVGPISFNDGNGNTSLPTAFSLGETAVDFDIAPPINVGDPSEMESENTENNNQSNLSKLSNKTLSETKITTKSNAKKVEWPIIVLRENGNIYVLMAGIDTKRPRLQGPLTMTPHSNDNYGLDSCAILVIPSLPPTLVIAESNGKLHHALFLEAESAEDSYNEIDCTVNIEPSEWTVHVLETVELELGLPRQDVVRHYSCPIHLKRDFVNELRYFAYHNTGVHVITINFITELHRFVETEVCSDIVTFSNPSRAEYIVCTKIDSGKCINAVLGFVLLQMPSGCVLLLSSGQVISLKLVIDSLLLEYPAITESNSDDHKSLRDSQLDQLLGPTFVDHIKSILKRTVTQPILSVDKSTNPSPEECYELLTQALEVLRSQYVKKHETVLAEFAKRLNTIKLRKEQQKKEIEYLEIEREHIRVNAHSLAERIEEISERQEFLTKRCQDLIRQANTCLPCNMVAEEEFSQEVQTINKDTKSMAKSMQKIRETLERQAYHIAKYKETAKHKSFPLPPKQENTIKEILLQINSEIEGQIREVKRINKILKI